MHAIRALNWLISLCKYTYNQQHFISTTADPSTFWNIEKNVLLKREWAKLNVFQWVTNYSNISDNFMHVRYVMCDGGQVYFLLKVFACAVCVSIYDVLDLNLTWLGCISTHESTLKTDYKVPCLWPLHSNECSQPHLRGLRVFQPSEIQWGPLQGRV